MSSLKINTFFISCDLSFIMFASIHKIKKINFSIIYPPPQSEPSVSKHIIFHILREAHSTYGLYLVYQYIGGTTCVVFVIWCWLCWFHYGQLGSCVITASYHKSGYESTTRDAKTGSFDVSSSNMSFKINILIQNGKQIISICNQCEGNHALNVVHVFWSNVISWRSFIGNIITWQMLVPYGVTRPQWVMLISCDV